MIVLNACKSRQAAAQALCCTQILAPKVHSQLRQNSTSAFAILLAAVDAFLLVSAHCFATMDFHTAMLMQHTMHALHLRSMLKGCVYLCTAR